MFVAFKVKQKKIIYNTQVHVTLQKMWQHYFPFNFYGGCFKERKKKLKSK